jgi:PAS domain S-box-containing protein
MKIIKHSSHNNHTLPAIFFSLLAAIALLVVVLFTSSQYLLFKENITNRLNNDLHRASNTISVFFIQNITIFKTISTLPAITEQDSLAADRIFQHLNIAYPQIANAAAVDKDGLFFASGRPFDKDNPPSISAVPFFQKIRDGLSLVIMDPHIGPITHQKVTGIALPIYDTAGNFNGLFGGSIYFDELQNIVDNIEPLLTTDLLVIDRNKTLQLASTPFRHLIESKLDIVQDSGNPNQTLNLNSKLYNFHSTRLPDSDFLVVTITPKATFSDFIQQSYTLCIIILLFILLFCISAFLIRKDYRQLQQISSHEEQLRAIYDAADSVSLVTTDIQGKDSRILSFSRGAEIIFGYSSAEMIGKPVAHLHRPENVQHFIEIQNKLKNGRERFSGEITLLRKSGEEFPAFFHVHPLFNNRSKLIGILCVTIDISAEKLREQEKSKLESQLRQAQKMETIGRLTGGIAHDFNNILAAVIGYAEIAMEDLPENSPAHNDISAILTAGNRARDLVQHLLAFSRITPQGKKPIRIQRVLKEALKLLHATVPSSITIADTIDMSCPMVLANETQIHQVIINLCTNSTHAINDDQGTITVSLSNRFLDHNDLADQPGFEPAHYVLLSICDTGTGIPAAERERVFEPYYTTKEVGKGSGLGLAVVHGIIQNHSGIIQLRDNIPAGTCFDIFLPCTDISPLDQEDQTQADIIGGNERILLVDDEPAILDITRNILNRLGYETTCCPEGQTALATFTKNPENFDLVITDQTMPNMTGEELAEQLSRLKKDLPIIICTGYSKMMTQERAGKLGLRHFLMKPVSRHDLAQAVREALDKGQ